MNFLTTVAKGFLLTLVTAGLAIFAVFVVMILGGLVTLFQHPPFPESFLIGLLALAPTTAVLYLVGKYVVPGVLTYLDHLDDKL